MVKRPKSTMWASLRLAAFCGAILLTTPTISAVNAAEPIKLGFGMAQTGALAGNGKAAILAIQMWAQDVNKKGGLLGRPVELVYYDDQTKPAAVPAIYSKLLDVDKVDLIVSGYGTNVIAPLLPMAIERGLTVSTVM